MVGRADNSGGGVLRVMLLRGNDNEVNLEETDDGNELNEKM